MFDQTAPYYDRIYAEKDYAGEAERVSSFAAEELGRPVGRLLDVACGTGLHLEHLRRWFDVEGLDLSPELLEIACKRLPEVPFHCDDMRSFRLEGRFDVITCLFSSIGYLLTLDDVTRALRTMADHLAPGGVILVDAWFTPDEWMPGTVHAILVDEPDLKIARVCTSLVDGRTSIVDLHYLIGTPEGTRHVMEPHRLQLYTVDEMMSAFERAGLRARRDETGICGRNTYIARKKTESEAS